MRPGASMGVAVACAALGCAPAAAPTVDLPATGCEALATLRLQPDVGLGQEGYVCFGFDAPAALDGRGVGRIEQVVAPGSPVVLHHTSIYAVGGDFPDGPMGCLAMPDGATSIDVWTTGGAPLAMPDGLALALPAGTRRLVVQSHLLRATTGPAIDETIRLCAPPRPPDHLAAWMRAPAPVPAIRPHTTETSTARCHVAGALQLLSAWPHMHRHGAAFHGALVGAAGARRPLVDVDPWQFELQPIYPLALAAAAGDVVETTCVWRNDGADYVLPGPGVGDEMCSFALVAWPAAAARCLP